MDFLREVVWYTGVAIAGVVIGFAAYVLIARFLEWCMRALRNGNGNGNNHGNHE